MKSFILCEMRGGVPNIGDLPYYGFVLCDQLGSYGAYLFSGTAGELAAIAALPNTVEIVTCSTDADNPDPTSASEFGQVVAGIAKKNVELARLKLKTRLNPAKTARMCIDELYKEFNAHFDLSGFSIAEPPKKAVEPAPKEGKL